MYLSNLGRFVGSAIGVLSLSLHASVQTAPPSGGAKNDRYPCLPPMTYDSAIGRNPCLPLMIRTEVPALPELCFAKSPVRTIRWSQENGITPAFFSVRVRNKKVMQCLSVT